MAAACWRGEGCLIKSSGGCDHACSSHGLPLPPERMKLLCGASVPHDLLCVSQSVMATTMAKWQGCKQDYWRQGPARTMHADFTLSAGC